jgi:hypothetical protein|nr:hypothetical protein [Kofleriaceae bacterium]
MKRFALAATFLVGACNLYFDDGSGHKPPPASGGGGGYSGGSGGAGIDGGSYMADAFDPHGSFDYTEYLNNVYPVLQAECAACHVGGTVAIFGPSIDPASMYSWIIEQPTLSGCGSPASSRLLTKGVHEGPALSASEASAIQQWLLDASADGSIDCVPPPPPSAKLLAEQQFAACETVSGTDITSSGAAQLANLNSDAGTCASCHSPGGPDGLLLGSASAMLASWETQPGLESTFTTQLAPDGVSYQVVFNYALFDAKGTEQANGTGTHPSYVLLKSVYDGMADFVAEIDALGAAGVCPTPGFY